MAQQKKIKSDRYIESVSVTVRIILFLDNTADYVYSFNTHSLIIIILFLLPYLQGIYKKFAQYYPDLLVDDNKIFLGMPRPTHFTDLDLYTEDCQSTDDPMQAVISP